MLLMVPAPGRKFSPATLLLLLLLFPSLVSIAGVGQQPPAKARTATKPSRVVASARTDRSRALRDIPPRPPSRDHVEREMHKPRPLRGKPRSKVGRLDPVVQSSAPAASMPSSNQNFEGVANVNGVLPPDTNGAVGPNHYVQWVNLSFAIYDKSGTKLYGPADGSTIWSGFGGACELTNNGDPIVIHDDLADRWVMSQLALPYFPFGPFYQCVAISQTADPTGAYYRYEFIISETKLNDYPKLGVWPDAYYLAVNQFDVLTSAFLGQGVVAFERDQMLAGQPARMIYFDLFDVDPNLGGMLPSHADGTAPPPGSPNIFVQVDDDGLGQAPQDQLQLWEFHVDWSNPAASTFTGPAILATAPFDSNLCNYSRNCIPQPATNRRVDPIPDRLMYRLQYRNFGSHSSLVVNHTVDVGNDHAGIRWYEIRDPQGTPVLYQQGTYAPDGDHRWMGSVAMGAAGNMALGYSVSSANTFPSIRYAGRLASDPLGTLAQGETELMTGSGSQTDSTGRWGDYSSMNVDPTDHCTFWYTQQYYAITSGSGWQTRIGAFSFPFCASGLPSVTVSATISQATEDGATSGVFTFSRTGSTGADLTVNFAVSGSATPGTDYTAIPSTVTIPAGSATATISVTAIDDPLVEINETIIVTLGPDAAYTTGTPSSAIVYIVNDDFPPDLIVSAFSAPTATGAGQAITVTDTTKNQGGGPADSSTTRFYLSTNTGLDAGDTLLGERTVPALIAGVSSAASTSLTIPSGTSGGAYYVLARADADNSVIESQELNNLNYAFIQVGADLVVSALSGPVTAGAGSTISLTDTTKNQGGGSAAASTTRFYLSTNTTFDASDVALGARSVPALSPGATSAASTSVTVPTGTTGGAYYLLAKADADSAVAETQEFNNLNYVYIQVGPDLVVSALTAPAATGAGATISVTDVTKNQGGGSAGASTTRFYLSTNTTQDAADVVLGARSVSVLAPGATQMGTTALTIPSSTAGGAYYLLAKADADSAVTETQEFNNINYAYIQIGPDLVISALTAPATAGAGSSITVTDTTKNQGSGSAGASTTRFYLSTNTFFDASDVSLGVRSVPALAPGTTSVAATTVTIPAGTAGGAYYLLARADADAAVAETQEFNNVHYSALQVGPDLTVSTFTAPAVAAAGTPITLTETTANVGGGPAGTSATRFYLSTNTVFDAADVSLGARAVPALAAGASSSASTSVTIPAGTAGGAYYLLARADGDDAIAETQEFNNVRYSYVQIGADLVVSALTAPVTAGAGSTFTVTDTTWNQGGGTAGASVTRFYLSANTVLDAGDVALGARAVASLAPGATSSASTSITIPSGTAGGAYYLIAKADADDAIAETQEFNNVRSSFIQVGPDLVVSAFSAPVTAGAGSTVNITETTRNQGGGVADPSTTGFYLSLNTVFDASDVFLASRAVPALAPGATNSATTSVTIPAATATGSYFLLARADSGNSVAETQESNNVNYGIVQVGPDMVVVVFTAPSTAAVGSTISVTDTTRNQGGGAAGASATRFYLSTNTLVDAGDILLGGRAVPSLNAGSSDSASTTINVPAGTAPGTYFLLAKADADGAVAETQEFNNIRVAVITITAN